MIVYRITNRANGKSYIGATTATMWARFAHHWRRACSGAQTPLHRALRKYGRECFWIEEVARCSSRDEMFAIEREIIARLRTYSYGYNATRGGDGHVSDEGLARMVASGKARGFPRHGAEKAWALSRGRKWPRDVVERRAAALRGRKLSREFCEAMSAARKGKKFGPLDVAHRASISRGLKGRKLSAEHCARMRDVAAKKAVTVDGVTYPSLKDCAAALGLSSGNAVRYWVRIGRAAWADDTPGLSVGPSYYERNREARVAYASAYRLRKRQERSA